MKLLSSLLASSLGHQFDITKESAKVFQSVGVDLSGFNIINGDGGQVDLEGNPVEDPFLTKGVAAYATRWTPLVQGGPVTVPFAIHSSVSSFEDNITSSMSALANDLACFDMPYVTDPSTTEYTNGIVFITNPSSCFSALGKVPGYSNNDSGYASVTELGVPAGWQVINLSNNCAGSIEVVQHEVLHALGFLHEQSRPDRDNYLNVNMDATYEPCKILIKENSSFIEMKLRRCVTLLPKLPIFEQR